MKSNAHLLMVVGLLLFLIGVYYSIVRKDSVFHAEGVKLITEVTDKVVGTPAPTATPMDLPPGAAAKMIPAALAPEAQHKLDVLKEILASHNDNDPRMDSELGMLSPEAKRAMETYYQEIKPEKRNERGTIAFLIGQKISSKEDIDFLKSVLAEKMCLSLADCSKPGTPATGEAEHLEGINETTAAYPQLMAIRALVKQYQEMATDPDNNSERMAQIIRALEDSTHSENPRSVQEAQNALKALHKD